MVALCKNYSCFSKCKRSGSCEKRCMVVSSMTIKNQFRRFAKCSMFDSSSRCDYFEWIDDFLCDKVRSIVVSLIMLNETLLEEN